MQSAGQILDRPGLAHHLPYQPPTLFRQNREHALRVVKRQRDLAIESLGLISSVGRVVRGREKPDHSICANDDFAHDLFPRFPFTIASHSRWSVSIARNPGWRQLPWPVVNLPYLSNFD